MVINMECRAFMTSLPANSFDSIVTDPPYGLSKQPNMKEVLKHWLNGDDYQATGGGFMGKSWDSFVPGPKTWEQAFRVLKPGGYAVVFAGSRTVDLMATSLRLAGFEVVDMLHWMYGSGFPKSMDIGKQLDKSRACAAFDDLRAYLRGAIKQSGLTQAEVKKRLGYPSDSGVVGHWVGKSQPSVPLWADWEKMREFLPLDDRYDHMLRPADREVVGRASASAFGPDSKDRHTIGSRVTTTVNVTEAHTAEAQQWDGWGTALKPCHEPIILCRKPLDGTYANNILTHGVGALNIDECRVPWQSEKDEKASKAKNQHGDFGSGQRGNKIYGADTNDSTNYDAPGRWPGNVLHDGCLPEPMDRYFYHAKASRQDRDEGLEDFEYHSAAEVVGRTAGSDGMNSPRAGAGRTSGARNTHPTVKPTAVMQWLCRLITPPGGTLLDPFCGSGSTLKAAALEGFDAVGCEMDPHSAAIATAREEAAKCKRKST